MRHVAGFLTLVVCSFGLATGQTKVNFQREVKPILSDGCFLCHGPDKSTRMVNLRLDIPEGAFEKRRTGQVVTPGQLNLSASRVQYLGPDGSMARSSGRLWMASGEGGGSK